MRLSGPISGATASTSTTRLVPAPALAAGAPAAKSTLRVAQMNLWNLYDTINDPKTDDDDYTPTPEQYAIKLQKIANAIVELGTPDLISLNEIENDTVVQDLINSPALKGAGYKFVTSGLNDGRGIRVGVIYRDDKLEATGHEEINPKMSFPDGGKGQVDTSLLYARAPLIVHFKARGAAQAAEGAGELTVAINHFKSKLGGWAPEQRRRMQGQYLGEWLDAQRANNPGGTTLVLGDLNSGYGEGAYEKLTTRPDGTKRFWDAPSTLPDSDRYTYIYRGGHDLLDHVLVDPARQDSVKAVKILHVNSPQDAKKSQWDPKVLAGFSDHDPTVVDFDLGKLLAAH